eukprot:gene5852-7281_t
MNITHNKANSIKRSISTLIPIRNWTSLSVEHDSLDHEFDKSLHHVINQIYQQPDASKHSSSSSSTSDNSNNDNTSNRSSSKSSPLGSFESIDIFNINLKQLNQSIDQQISMIDKLLLVFSSDGNLSSIQQQRQQQGEVEGEDEEPDELNPSKTYKYGKHFVLSHLFVDQIVTILDFLFYISMDIEESLDYWNRKIDDRSWYVFEKTPFFWLQYFYQEMNKNVSFTRRFQEIHNVSSSRTFYYYSTLTTKLNQTVSTFNSISKRIDQFLKQKLKKRDRNSNENDDDQDQQEEYQYENQQQQQNEEPLQQHEDQQQQQQNNNELILHPIKELEERLHRLHKFSKIITTCLGRLSFLLESVKDFNSLSQFNIMMSQATVLVYDTLLLLNESFPDQQQQQTDENNQQKIDITINQLLDYSKFLKTISHDQQLFSTSIDNINNNSNSFLVEYYQESLYFMINENAHFSKKVFQSIGSTLQKDHCPGFFTRNWFKITAGAILTYCAIRYTYDNMDVFKENLHDLYNAAIRFYKDHLEEPLLNIWSVIRYDKKTLTVTDPASLQSSMDSLTRMVVDYSVDTKSGFDKDLLVQLTEKGDISSIMKSYELNIRNPLKNIVFGDLVRLILIQVQKEKVDVDKAMIAIDKLLQANELNFQLLAAIPACLILGFGLTKAKSLLTDRKKTVPYSQFIIFSTLRKIQRNLTQTCSNPQMLLPVYLSPLILASPLPYFETFYNSTIYQEYIHQIPQQQQQQQNQQPQQSVIIKPKIGSSGIGSGKSYPSHYFRNVPTSQYIPFEQYGIVLAMTSQLKLHHRFIKNPTESQWFREDLQDLESETLGSHEKILTINRMFNTYSFLKNYKLNE